MENKIIEILMQQIADLKAENADLRTIIKEFAGKETNVVVNSYNGSSATAEADGSTTNRNRTTHNDHAPQMKTINNNM